MSNILQRQNTYLRRQDLELNDAASTISSQSMTVARPKALLNSAVATTNSIAKYWGYYFNHLKQLYKRLLSPHDPQAYFQHLLGVASNYEQWDEAADKLQGKDKRKDDLRSPDYNYELIATHLMQLRRAGAEGDLSNIIFLRTSLSRNLGHMGKPRLYAYTHIGTKTLIEDYIDEVVHQLNMIYDTKSEDFDLKQQYEIKQ